MPARIWDVTGVSEEAEILIHTYIRHLCHP